MFEIDHAIMTVDDPEATAADLAERAGLRAVPGGRHPGHGTANWLVPLGSSYLELMYVADGTEAEGSALGRWVAEETRNGDRLAAVCLRSDDIEETARHIGDDVETMQREAAEGRTLRWRLTGLLAAMSEERLPFFIQWDVPDDAHPSRLDVDHASVPDGITWVEWGGDPQRLGEWLHGEAAALRLIDALPGPRRLSITTSDGPVVLGPSGLR